MGTTGSHAGYITLERLLLSRLRSAVYRGPAALQDSVSEALIGAFTRRESAD